MRIVKKIIFIIVMLLLPTSLFAQNVDNLKDAVSFYNVGNYSEAVKLFDLFLDHKSDAKVHYLKGYALYKMKKFNKAFKSFNKAYLLDPKLKVSKATDVLIAVGMFSETNASKESN